MTVLEVIDEELVLYVTDCHWNSEKYQWERSHGMTKRVDRNHVKKYIKCASCDYQLGVSNPDEKSFEVPPNFMRKWGRLESEALYKKYGQPMDIHYDMDEETCTFCQDQTRTPVTIKGDPYCVYCVRHNLDDILMENVL